MELVGHHRGVDGAIEFEEDVVHIEEEYGFVIGQPSDEFPGPLIGFEALFCITSRAAIGLLVSVGARENFGVSLG